MPFKPGAKKKSPSDLMGLLVNSKVQTSNNALYQTIFGLITIQQQVDALQAEAMKELKKEIDALKPEEQIEIPGFFFMGSS